MHRRDVLIGSVAVLAASAGPASAVEIKDFDAKAFAAAQDAGRGIVVWVHASW